MTFGRRVTMGFSFEHALAYAREEEGRVQSGAYREAVAYQTTRRGGGAGMARPIGNGDPFQATVPPSR
ncbi:hypothetical protein PQR64_13800 [Paraburkholderia phytofirmans]|uniref:hypothetical protein n=1 Tax=Paraburkholderia phytofirmans TaxID=261302 RepID=UPI0038BA35CF